MNKWVDSVGNELKEGDIIRMYHFTGSRKKKYFMYKRFKGFFKGLGVYEI